MTKYAEIETILTNTVVVKCDTCRHQLPVAYTNSSRNHPFCRKGVITLCALNGYTEWEYAGRGTVKKVFETS